MVQHLQHGDADAVLGCRKDGRGVGRGEAGKGRLPHPRDGGAIDEAVDLVQRHRPPGLQRGGETRPARGFDIAEGHVRRRLRQIACDTGRQSAAADRQDDQIGGRPHLRQHLHPHARLPLDHVGIIEGGEEPGVLLDGEHLCRRERLVEIVPGQPDFDIVAAEDTGLVDLLLWRGDGHEDRSHDAEMPTGEGHALRVVPGARADKAALVRTPGQHLAHGVEGAAQLVAAHGGQILALQPDVGFVAGGKEIVALQRRLGEERPDCPGRRHRIFEKPAHS